MIEPLYSYSSSQNGIDYIRHPTIGDLMDKINEIVDKFNELEQNYINDLTEKEMSEGHD